MPRIFNIFILHFLCISLPFCAAFDFPLRFSSLSTTLRAPIPRYSPSPSSADHESHVTIHPAITDDDLLEASFFSIGAFFGDVDPKPFKQVQSEQFALWRRTYGSGRSKSSQKSSFFVARCSTGSVVGCASVAVKNYAALKNGALTVFNPFGDTSLHRKNFDMVPILANVAVCPSQRRRGIGKLLADECESIARVWGFDEIALSVEVGNLPAQRLYETLGYSVLWDNIRSTRVEIDGLKMMPSKKCLTNAMTKPLPRTSSIDLAKAAGLSVN